jgi:hypothetical protein
MIMPLTEPNSLPPLFSDAQDWRHTYAAYVADFQDSAKTFADKTLLKIRLKRLGFVGANLDNEFRFIVEGVPV